MALDLIRVKLDQRDMEYVEVSGDWDKRFETAVNSVNSILKGEDK